MLDLDSNSFGKLISGGQPALVDFWAPWCMPCRIFSPVLESLMDEFDGKFTFARLNIDDYSDFAVKYDIVSIPTVILFKNGVPVEQIVGVHSRQEVLDTLNTHL